MNFFNAFWIAKQSVHFALDPSYERRLRIHAFGGIVRAFCDSPFPLWILQRFSNEFRKTHNLSTYFDQSQQT